MSGRPTGAVGPTERTPQQGLGDTGDVGIVFLERIGGRHRYDVHPRRALSRPLESHRTVRDLLSRVR
jgi:hypothetical protein